MEKKTMVATNEKVSNYIPDEISYSILSKLPLKSLKRFECVQKSWSLLFENHHFMNMFRNKFLSYNNDPASLILRACFNYDDEVFYSFSGERFENKFKLDWSNSFRDRFHTRCILGYGSVNGTLCLYGASDNIVLWNPATQTIKPLPHSEDAQFIEYSIPDEDLGDVHLCVHYHAHGFGYDPLIDDYKVIRFVNLSLESLPESDDDTDDEMIDLDLLSYTGFEPFWEIYSLTSNSWRELDVDMMPYSLFYGEGTQVYMNGVCHWLCEENYSNVGPCLVSFYLTNEEFIVTPIPSDLDDCFIDKLTWIKLAVLNQSITLISYHKETTTFHISILGAFGFDKSWTKLLIVGPLSCVERPIGVGMKGEIVFVRKDKELVWLDLSTQMIAELGYKGGALPNKIIMYKESILAIE
jgi:molecular chaperone HtpG